MTITRISKTKQGRYALFDEENAFQFSVDGDTLLLNHIKEGTVLDQATLEMIKQQSDTRKAKDKALGYLSLRDYASGELYDKLCQKFDEHSAAAAVAYMKQLELLNDENFAKHRAAYLARHHKSTREIRQQLNAKGISRDLIDIALEEVMPQDEEACFAVLQKSYLSKLQKGQTDKVIAALSRKGFSYGAIKTALAHWEEQWED